jgi:hypothetical protein
MDGTIVEKSGLMVAYTIGIMEHHIINKESLYFLSNLPSNQELQASSSLLPSSTRPLELGAIRWGTLALLKHPTLP